MQISLEDQYLLTAFSKTNSAPRTVNKESGEYTELELPVSVLANAVEDAGKEWTEGFPGEPQSRVCASCNHSSRPEKTREEHCGLSSVEESQTLVFKVKLQAMTIHRKQQHRKQSEARVRVSPAKEPARKK